MGPPDIRVNSVAPGVVWTPRVSAMLGEEGESATVANTPLRRRRATGRHRRRDPVPRFGPRLLRHGPDADASTAAWGPSSRTRWPICDGAAVGRRLRTARLGVAGDGRVPYPRADPDDLADCPATPSAPPGFRSACASSSSVTPRPRARLHDAYRRLRLSGPGRGHDLPVVRAGSQCRRAAAVLGDGSVRLALGGGTPDAPPSCTSRRACDRRAHHRGGRRHIEPAPAQPALARVRRLHRRGLDRVGTGRRVAGGHGREYELDVVNLGYAGSAHGEIASAEQIAKLDADVISISHGTNCWTRVPFSPGCSARTRCVPAHRPRGASRAFRSS